MAHNHLNPYCCVAVSYTHLRAHVQRCSAIEEQRGSAAVGQDVQSACRATAAAPPATAVARVLAKKCLQAGITQLLAGVLGPVAPGSRTCQTPLITALILSAAAD